MHIANVPVFQQIFVPLLPVPGTTNEKPMFVYLKVASGGCRLSDSQEL